MNTETKDKDTIGNMTNEDLDTRIQVIVSNAIAGQNTKIHNLELQMAGIENRLDTLDGRFDQLINSMTEQKSALEAIIRGNQEQSNRWDKAFDEVKTSIDSLKAPTTATAHATTPAPSATATAVEAKPEQKPSEVKEAAKGAVEGAKKGVDWKPGQIATTAVLTALAAGGGGYMYGRRRGQRMAEHQGGGEGGGTTAGGRGRAAMH